MGIHSYMTPIMDRTEEDVNYARTHQNDLNNKNKGAWNYTDLNRIGNNLLYAAEWMYEQGFLDHEYSMQIKTTWVESDIITYEQLNSMIINNMNALYRYARPDLQWYYLPSVANIDYTIANWIEFNIHQLATQEPVPPDKYKLTVNRGTGSGEYEARTEIVITADAPSQGEIFAYWSGDHLENIISGSGESATITYRMPLEDVTLTANYTSAIPHQLTIITNSSTTTRDLLMGERLPIEADPAPYGKVFHHWEVEPSKYDQNLDEPAATTVFTMPNEAVSLTAVYITKGNKTLNVYNGTGSGSYEYATTVAIHSNKPANATFTSWTGDVQYLTGPVTQEYNSVKIPDISNIKIYAHWTVPPTPLVTNVLLTVVNGVIESTGQTTGTFTEGNYVTISANTPEEGKTFSHWTRDEGDSRPSYSSEYNYRRMTIRIGTIASTFTAKYRDLEYYELTVITNSGTNVTSVERKSYFSINANPAPDGYTFDKWVGDTSGLTVTSASTGTTMGTANRTITAVYRPINPHTVTVHQLSGDVTYTETEFTKITITAENAPNGQVFDGWRMSGSGTINSYSAQSISYTFGNGDGELTPKYVNIWTITVINGTIDGSSSKVLKQGYEYNLRTRSLAVYEKFNGWAKSGAGTITHTASTYTYFTVGEGDATITANIEQYPDKTLTIYFEDPDTQTRSLVSSQTYQYGSRITNIIAPVAPDQTTFSSWVSASGNEQDLAILSPNALASTVNINSLTRDTSIVATYFYPEAPEYYTLTINGGTPNGGTYAAGSQVPINANQPAQGWEFFKWMGDTFFLVDNSPEGLANPSNAVIMPLQSVSLTAKFKLVGEQALFRVNVVDGRASAVYEDSQQQTHEVSDVYIDIPAGVTVTLTANPNPVGRVFDYWSGNFSSVGIDDIIVTNNPTTFTMVEADVNAYVNRRELDTYTVHTTNATGPGTTYEGTYPIMGNLVNTENIHYTFTHWTCVDVEDNNYISAIANPSSEETEITITDRDLWVKAWYTENYKLTVVSGQDSGDGYYYEGETVSTVTANAPEPRMQFDHWDDPVGIITNIYDPTPEITMKNSIATITAIYVSLENSENSIAITGTDLHRNIIYRSTTSPISGIFTVGTLIFDRDGCIGMIDTIDPDHNDNTDDYETQKLFYGGNF